MDGGKRYRGESGGCRGRLNGFMGQLGNRNKNRGRDCRGKEKTNGKRAQGWNREEV